MANVQKLLDAVSRLGLEDIAAIRAACEARRKYLFELRQKAEQEAAWDRVKALKPGARVYCHAKGTFLGGSVQRGDSATVVCVQPRARRLWLDVDRDGKRYWFEGLPSLLRYDWREAPPSDPLSGDARRAANTVARAIAGRA